MPRAPARLTTRLTQSAGIVMDPARPASAGSQVSVLASQMPPSAIVPAATLPTQVATREMGRSGWFCCSIRIPDRIAEWP